MLLPHLIRLGIGSNDRDWLIIIPSSDEVSLPASTLRTQSLSCLPSLSTLLGSSLRFKPFLFAKACAALVALPSESNATFMGGPQATISVSGVRTSRSLIMTARRRGAANDCTSLKFNLFSPRPFCIPSTSALERLIKAFGGNSSVPNSNNKSAFIWTLQHVELTLLARFLVTLRETRLPSESRSNLERLRVQECEP